MPLPEEEKCARHDARHRTCTHHFCIPVYIPVVLRKAHPRLTRVPLLIPSESHSIRRATLTALLFIDYARMRTCVRTHASSHERTHASSHVRNARMLKPAGDKQTDTAHTRSIRSTQYAVNSGQNCADGSIDNSYLPERRGWLRIRPRTPNV